MAIPISDTSSHRRDQIHNFAEILRNAPSKQIIFSAVYRGKKRFKTVKEIAAATPFSSKRVTELAKPLAKGEKLFEQDREVVDGYAQTIYRKIDFVETNKKRILRLAKNREQFEEYHTKTNPGTYQQGQRIIVRVPFRTTSKFVGIDDVEQFRKARKVRRISKTLQPARLAESRVKKGILRLLGESKEQRDWGGENNDIFTARLTLNGTKRRAAFALKGPATNGPLVPAKMGKNGDQVQRLFDSPADVFFVQYEGEITEKIIRLMEGLASAKAILCGQVFWGIIDKDDTYRLRVAYPRVFKT